MWDTIEQYLKDNININVGRSWKAREWEFNKMVLDKNGSWILIVDFIDQIENLDMNFIISVVLNPANYNSGIRRINDKFFDPQKKLFESDDQVIADIEKIKEDYKKEAELYGTFDFTATVMKFERKTKSRQVKFFIPTSVQESVVTYFLEHFDELHRSALVLNKQV